MITTINEFRKINENTNVGGHFSIIENGDLKISIEGIDADVLADMTVYQDGNDDHFLWQFFESELTNGYNLVSDEYKGLTEAPMISDSIIDEETDPAENINVWAFMDYQVVSVKDVLLKDGFVIFNKANNPTNEGIVVPGEAFQKWYDKTIVPAIASITETCAKLPKIAQKLSDEQNEKKYYTTDVLYIKTELDSIMEGFKNNPKYNENKTTNESIQNISEIRVHYYKAVSALQTAINEIDYARGVMNDNFSVGQISKMESYQQFLDICSDISEIKTKLNAVEFPVKR